jgi:hypothetical protein
MAVNDASIDVRLFMFHVHTQMDTLPIVSSPPLCLGDIVVTSPEPTAALAALASSEKMPPSP